MDLLSELAMGFPSDSSSSSYSDSDDDFLEDMMVICAVFIAVANTFDLLSDDSSSSENEGLDDMKEEATVTEIKTVTPNQIGEEIQQSVDPNEHLQQQNSERSQAATPATPKQLSTEDDSYPWNDRPGRTKSYKTVSVSNLKAYILHFVHHPRSSST